MRCIHDRSEGSNDAFCDLLAVKYYSPQTGICIIRVARDHHKVAWAGLTLLSNIEGHVFVPNVVHLSGAYCFVLSWVRDANSTAMNRHYKAGPVGGDSA